MSKKQFFATIKMSLFNGALNQDQVDGFNAIIKHYNDIHLNDLRKLAYVMATVYHETAKTIKPIPEYGKGKGMAYGGKLKMGAGPNKRIPYTTPDQLYYGRGLVQLTWFENYEQFGKLLSIDLLNNPDLMLKMDVSVAVLFKGMTGGLFTGASLGKFITEEVTDFTNCRRIINGMDKAAMIAGYAVKFFEALTKL